MVSTIDARHVVRAPWLNKPNATLASVSLTPQRCKAHSGYLELVAFVDELGRAAEPEAAGWGDASLSITSFVTDSA